MHLVDRALFVRGERRREAHESHHRQRRRHHDEVARVLAHGAHGADRLALHDDAPVRVPPQARDARTVPDEIPERRVARRDQGLHQPLHPSDQLQVLAVVVEHKETQHL